MRGFGSGDKCLGLGGFGAALTVVLLVAFIVAITLIRLRTLPDSVVDPLARITNDGMEK